MIKQLIKEALVEILAGGTVNTGETLPTYRHPMLGERVVVRCRNAGVHYGELVASGDHVILKNSHRIWKWSGAFSLSEVSQNGISGGRIACEVETLSIPSLDVAEILNLTDKAHGSFSDHLES